MSGKFEQWQHRRLYLREEGTFALLPAYCRALAAELLKFCDDEGRIALGGREPWLAIARVISAERGERRMVKKHVSMLLKDGYLLVDGEHVRIRNLRDAQDAPETAPAQPTRPRVVGAGEHQPCTSRAPAVRERGASGAQAVHERCTKNEVRPRNDVAAAGTEPATRALRISDPDLDLNRESEPATARARARVGLFPGEAEVLTALESHAALRELEGEGADLVAMAKALAADFENRAPVPADAARRRPQMLAGILDAATEIGTRRAGGRRDPPAEALGLVRRYVSSELRKAPPPPAAPPPPSGIRPVGTRDPTAKPPPPRLVTGGAR